MFFFKGLREKKLFWKSVFSKVEQEANKVGLPGLAVAAQEFLEVNGPGSELLRLCEMDVLSHVSSLLFVDYGR